MSFKNRKNLIAILILAIGALSCNKAGNTEVVFAPTEVGTPQGDKVSKNIGPEGGTLASPDGRMTLKVPQGALTETIPFSMQPITNKAVNGIGLGYRLEPNGKTFPKPLEIAIKYDDKDLVGTVPEALTIAYQDEKRAWHAQRSAKLDKAAKTLTIAATHFTDWAFLARLWMSPVKTTLKVGHSQFIEMVYCQDQGFIDRVLSRPQNCSSVTAPINVWSVQGEGTLSDTGGRGMLYTAPARKPSPNIAYVVLEYEFEQWDETRMERMTGELATTITIVDSGYKASGQDGPVVYSGKICDLEAPFLVGGVHPLFLIPMHFTPSSGTTGKMKYETSGRGITASGSGTYKIEGLDTDKPRIVMDTQSTASIPVATTSGGGKATINLTPIGPGEGCN